MDSNTNHVQSFLGTAGLDNSELLKLIKLSLTLKDHYSEEPVSDILKGQVLSFVSFRNSRLPLAVKRAMHSLGGAAVDVTLDPRESLADAARAISQLSDFIMIDSAPITSISEFAEAATVPVISALSDYEDPVQELADIVTIYSHLPDGKAMDKVKVVYVGEASMMAASLMLATSKLGMDFVQFAPPSKWLSDEYLKLGRAHNQRYGGSVHVTDNPAFLEGADFLYTDAWSGRGAEEIPRDVYMRDLFPKYQVSENMLKQVGNDQVKFLHPLPAHRGEEVVDAVIDGKNSLVLEEQRNLLHAIRAILVYLAGKSSEILS